MSMSPQDYAELAEHSYDRKGDMRSLVNKEVVLEGVTYKIIEHVDNRSNGYQGTIYQRVDSGEIIVAHRGTEFERERWNDLVKTDGSMVLSRLNPQAEDAIALTARARALAADPHNFDNYGHVPEVTVTGHSLGGTLAQITAHHFDLRGETFNAYGAVSLNYRIPEGGNLIINHVTAADLVSSASPHYGQVREYAMPQEVEMLRDKGYANDDSRLFDLRNKLGAAIDGLGSHDMHYFLNKNGDGRPDRSVLSDPSTRERAQQYAPMIEKYREDVQEMRRNLAMGLRGPSGLIRDGIEHLRGPLEPGEPASRERDAAPTHGKTAGLPDSLGDLRNRVAEAFSENNIAIPADRLDRVTAAVALDMQRLGLTRVDKVFVTADPSGNLGVESGVGVQQGMYPLLLRSQTPGDAIPPLEDSLRHLAQSDQAQRNEQQRVAQLVMV